MADARQLQLGEVIFASSAGFTSSGPGRVEDLDEKMVKSRQMVNFLVVGI